MSTKLSPKIVNKLGFRFRPLVLEPRCSLTLSDGGSELPDPTPVVVPVRLPTLEQRIARLEHAGAVRQAWFENYSEDDFGDDFDDIPEEGLSPHELPDHEIGVNARNARKKAADAKKASAATPPAGEPQAAPTAKPVGEPASPKGAN